MTTEPGTLASGSTDTLSCCTAFYEQDWVRLLAEESFHPGGAELTWRTVAAMQLPANGAVLDLGCGTGTTALLLSREFDYRVSGIDASAANIERASRRCDSAAVCFDRADAHALPFEDSAFDGVLSECVFSLLTDKQAALREIHRVLKPGGRVGLTDMAIEGTLPDDLVDIVAPWTCLTDAADEGAYCAMFADAGFTITTVANESAGLEALLGSIRRKLLLAGASVAFSGGEGFDLATVRHWLDRFGDEVGRGSIRYLRFQLAVYGIRTA